jgi:hypothetical protein
MRGQEWFGPLRAKLGEWPFRGPEPADPPEGIAVGQSVAELDTSETEPGESQDRA